MILSMHIPKTGGSAFRAALQERFGAAIILAYPRSKWAQPLYPLAPDRKLDAQYRAELAEYCRKHEVECIHGHFTLPSLYEVFPDATCITFLRDPLDRLISAYNHLSESRSASDLMTFEEFAGSPRVRNYYEQLGVLECLDALTFIGISEQYDRSLRLLEHKLPELGALASQKVNVSEKKKVTKLDVTPEMRERVLALNDGDVEIYEAAKECFEQECAQAGI